MADELISVTLEDGKYTIRETAPHQWECLRYGEPWPAFVDGPDNLHMALAREVDALRKGTWLVWRHVQVGDQVLVAAFPDEAPAKALAERLNTADGPGYKNVEAVFQAFDAGGA